MTPHAPWTKNWIRKPPSASSGIDTPSTPLQSGMISAPSTHEARIVTRRPKRCESPPSSVPPTIAPMFAMTAIVETIEGGKPCCLVKNVGKRSCEPCDMKLNAAISKIA